MNAHVRKPPADPPVFEAMEDRLLLSGTPWMPGDANADDVVDHLDLGVLATHYDQSGMGWSEGNFNADGQVDYIDLGILATFYGQRCLAGSVSIENLTGEAKTDWPVFLTVWKVFGPDLDVSRLNGEGFHVFDAAGVEVPHMLRQMPPDFSLGNDEIVFVVPGIQAGEARTYRVTNTTVGGDAVAIDLVGNHNNLLPNGGFESFTGGTPEGYVVASNSGATIAADTEVKHSGEQSLRITFPANKAATLKTADTVHIASGGNYHFSVWGRSENLAYAGYGFWAGGSLRFEPDAFTGETTKLALQDTREWFCYRFDAGGEDAWGVPWMASRGAGTRNVKFALGAWQRYAPFLLGDGTGTMWLDEALLFEQPAVTVDRAAPLEGVAEDGAVVFARPVNMPRTPAFAHEAVERLEAFAMRGERRQLRFGVHAVDPLTNVELAVSALTGPGGQIGTDRLDLESLGDYVSDYQPLATLPAAEAAEYLLGIDVLPDTAPGTYAGTVTFSAGGQAIREVPLTLEVLPMEVPSMEGIWVGGIYNIGFPLDRDDDFYVEYGKARFNYMMLFDYFSTHMRGAEIDLAGAQEQVDKMIALAHVTGGIGLYREPNMSEDQPRKWYQIASGRPDWEGAYHNGTDEQYREGYQALAVQLHQYGLDHGWPELLYMVSDEPGDPRDVDPSMGWLNDAIGDAMTPVDTMFHDMIQTWQWYTLPVLDNPANWTGPLVYDYVLANKSRFGFCGKAWGLAVGRYQPGLMMATTGSVYWHWWHTEGPFAERNGTVERMHHVAAMGAGVNDLRYYLALRQAIADNQTGDRAAVAAEAQALLDGVFEFANGDHDREVMPYNGVPWDWGDVRFYDNWRATMKDYLLALE